MLVVDRGYPPLTHAPADYLTVGDCLLVVVVGLLLVVVVMGGRLWVVVYVVVVVWLVHEGRTLRDRLTLRVCVSRALWRLVVARVCVLTLRRGVDVGTAEWTSVTELWVPS